MTINKIQKSYTRLFWINRLVVILLEISPTNHRFLKAFNTEFNYMEVWFTDQNSQPLEIEDRINLTLVIKWRL